MIELFLTSEPLFKVLLASAAVIFILGFIVPPIIYACQQRERIKTALGWKCYRTGMMVINGANRITDYMSRYYDDGECPDWADPELWEQSKL